MGITHRQQVMLAYTALSEFYQTPISDRALSIYAEDLEDLDIERVIDALRHMRREPGRRSLPLPQDVRAFVCKAGQDPIDDQACEMAARVVEAIGKFGYMRASSAREWLGEIGWQIVVAKGGWYYLCSSTMAGETAFFAQCRDLARGALRKQWRMEIDTRDAPKLGSGVKGLTQ